MGSLYKRGRFWWIGFKDADSAPTYRSTGEVSRAKARLVLDEVEAMVAMGHRQSDSAPRLRPHGEGWCDQRQARGLMNVRKERSRLRKFVFSKLGDLRLDEVTPKMVRRLVRDLRGPGGPAPRTLVNLYGTLHRLFEDAVADEIIRTNPCVLKRGELPARSDADATWRAKAVYSRDESERLITDARIPVTRRMAYALALVGGMRFGEVSALRWGDYDHGRAPLGVLQVHSSFNREAQKVKGTKTGQPRQVPVHPTLAAMLAAWKLRGWELVHGRKPTADDLVVPSSTGKHLQDHSMNKGRARDLKLLGLRHRRFHDMRRSFISQCLDEGAQKSILRWVTHGQGPTVVDQYQTPSWLALCNAVGCLRVGFQRGEVRAMKPEGADLLQFSLQSGAAKPQASATTAAFRAGDGGSNPPGDKRPYRSPEVVSGVFVRAGGASGQAGAARCSTVVSAAAIAEQGEQVLASLRRGENVEAQLEQLIAFARGGR